VKFGTIHPPFANHNEAEGMTELVAMACDCWTDQSSTMLSAFIAFFARQVHYSFLWKCFAITFPLKCC